jgi:hypothetical protein
MAYIDIIHALLPDNATGDISAADLRACFSLVDENIGKLVQVQENMNTGYRLYGKDANFHGDIGEQAIDLSEQTESSATKGATGRTSFATGFQTTAEGRYSYAAGFETIAKNDYQTALGKYNTAVSTETLFEIGNGDSITRSNALEVYQNGVIQAPESDLINIGAGSGKVLVTKEWVQDYGSRSELDKITETNTGWVLLGDDRTFKGDIGEHALDFSLSTEGSSGATGENSLAQGTGTIAQNKDQITTGTYNIGTNINTIHETGIGTNDTNRLNAFEIYRDGAIMAPTLTPVLIEATGDYCLVTKEYSDFVDGGDY